MAGKQRSPTEGGRSNGAAPARLLPRPSTDATLDLLTGLFPSASGSRNPFAPEQSAMEGGAPDRHQATATTTTTATQVVVGSGGALGAADVNPTFLNLMYSSQQPMDLLTGLLPPLPPGTTHSPVTVSPTSVVTQQDMWGPDILGLGHPPFGSGSSSSSIELFGSPEIAKNNPFLGNAVTSPAYSPPPPIVPISHNRGPDVSDGTNNRTSSRSGSMDGSFAKFPPLAESMASADLGGGRSSYSGNLGLSPAATVRIYKAQTLGNGGSPSTPSSNENSPVPVADSSSKSEHLRRLSSSGSSPGSGFERMQQNGPSRSPEPSSSPVPPSVGHAPQTENLRKSASESKYQQWAHSPPVVDNLRKSASDLKYQLRVPSEAGTPSRLSPSPTTESLRKSASGSKYEHWMPSSSLSEAGPSSRLPGKESGTAMLSSPNKGGGTVAEDEYVGAFGKGIYKSPVRGAIHPRRPVSLELRPHPLTGAPTNEVTLLTYLEGSVWAVCDLGLMVWDIKYATGEGSIATVNNPGDEDAAAYEFLKQGSPALCITADVANRVVWTGHRDGKIRSWPARAAASASREEPRSAGVAFEALRQAVTAILITPYGELWAGSESGELKAWPWNAVVKTLAGRSDGAAHMEMNFHDLRLGNIGVGPNGPLNPEVRFLVGNHAHGTVWCAGTQFMVIWDARTRERLKMFVGPNGLDMNSIDVGSPGREILLDEDLKVGYAKVSSKKDRGGWLQRSRNAVIGAADAVRRAASGASQGLEEGRKLEALVAAADGTVWGGYGNGVLVRWHSDGYKREIQLRSVGVRSLCTVGNRLWVGYSDGKLHVLDGDTFRAVGSWLAHRLAVIDMALAGGYIFSLGLSGSIRGWNISSPTGDLDKLMKAKMTNRADSYTRQQQLQVLVGSWNTAQEKASLQSTRSWLPSDLVAEASVVAVGLQEVEMGAGAIGMAAVKESVGMGLDNRSPTGQWWLNHLDSVLGEGKEFERLGSRQLAGMLVGVWVRRRLLPYVGDIEVGAVACGFGRTLGNKGAVGVKLTIFRRSICFLTSHLAAHMENVKNRNADFEHIYNQMSFGRVNRTNVTVVANAAAGVSSAVQNMLRGGNNSRRASITSDQNFIEREAPLKTDSNAVAEDAGLPELADADLLIWTGDLNYRIDYCPYEEVVNFITKRQWDVLLANDQLRFEMENGRTFPGMREGAIRFPPTYKFDKGTSHYDTSEKKRIPAWCDRVLFRDSFGSASDCTDSSKQGLIRPCKASVVRYEACMEPKESDHKPLRCLLSVDLSVTDEADRRFEYGDIIHYDQDVRTCLFKSGLIPETATSTNGLLLEDYTPSVLRLINKDGLQSAVYVIHCEGMSFPCPCGKHSDSERNSNGEDQYPRAGFGFPPWLQVVPAAGILEPGDSINIEVNVGMRPEDRGRNQQGNAVVVLVVNVKGVLSSEYKPHKICLSRVSSGQKQLAKDKGEARRRSQDRRPSSADSDSSSGYGSRQRSTPSSSSFRKSTAPDLLL